MKKFILIALVFCSVVAMGQDRKILTTLFTNLTPADTFFTVKMDQNYMWGVTLTWATGKVGNNAVVTIQASADSTTFFTYSTTSLDTVKTASGYWKYSDTDFPWRFMRVLVKAGDSVGVKLAGKLVKFRK